MTRRPRGSSRRTYPIWLSELPESRDVHFEVQQAEAWKLGSLEDPVPRVNLGWLLGKRVPSGVDIHEEPGPRGQIGSWIA
jgi:hypothetical protein